MFTSFILVTYTFKLSLLADINQGCITTLFSITGIYISILFYFVFNEVISKSKIIGIVFIVPCAVLLSLDDKETS